jgi:hypothetical protein
MLRIGACILISGFIFFTKSVSAQGYIGNSYKEVHKKLKKYKPGNDSAQVTISDSAGFLRMAVRGTTFQPADFTYGFDDKGKCRSEKVIAYCDACYEKFLKAVLDVKRFGWKKINENQYISSFKHRMMIELPVKEETAFFYLILRTNWTKETYAMLNPEK